MPCTVGTTQLSPDVAVCHPLINTDVTDVVVFNESINFVNNMFKLVTRNPRGTY